MANGSSISCETMAHVSCLLEVSRALCSSNLKVIELLNEKLREELFSKDFFAYNCSSLLKGGNLTRCFGAEWCIPARISREYVPIR